MNGRTLKTLWGLLLITALLPAQAQEVFYIHTDALGSPVAETDANRNVVARFEYEPYGRRLNGSNDDKPGYTGHVMDSATGLAYMQQRYYDPGIGVFLSVDPVTAYDDGDMRFFNRYAYAFNNPYKFTDPDGRQSESVMDRRYVYSRLNSQQVAGIEAQHNEIGGQTAKGMAIGAAGATIGVVAVKSGAASAAVGAVARGAESVGKATAAAESGYASAGVAVYAKGKEVASAVATTVVTKVGEAKVAVMTSPAAIEVTKHMDKVVDFAVGAFDKGSPMPPTSYSGVAGAVVGERLEKD